HQTSEEAHPAGWAFLRLQSAAHKAIQATTLPYKEPVNLILPVIAAPSVVKQHPAPITQAIL
ncbi:MAG: hypothetical protein RR896_24110, partial [Citrobacter sp.]